MGVSILPTHVITMLQKHINMRLLLQDFECCVEVEARLPLLTYSRWILRGGMAGMWETLTRLSPVILDALRIWFVRAPEFLAPKRYEAMLSSSSYSFGDLSKLSGSATRRETSLNARREEEHQQERQGLYNRVVGWCMLH